MSQAHLARARRPGAARLRLRARAASMACIASAACLGLGPAVLLAARAQGTAERPERPVGTPAPTTAGPVATPSAARSVLAVETVRPRQMTLDNSLSAAGSVAAWQEASVSPKTGGLRIANILAQVGSRVKRGDVMVEFDDETLRAELAQLQANVAEAEAAAAEARRGAERARKVGDSGALSAQQVEQLLTAETTAQARLLARQEAVNLQLLRLRQAQLQAPDDGIVSQRTATLGAVVPAGMELFRIIRGGRLEWRAEVPAQAMAKIAPGTPVRIGTDDGGTLHGTVRLVAPTVDPATRQGLVYADLPARHPFRPGMFVRGEFQLGAASAWVLPQSAVMLRDGFHFVARVGPDQRVSFTKIGVGRRQGTWVEVTDGLGPDQAVVARGAALLGEGDTVRLVGAAP